MTSTKKIKPFALKPFGAMSDEVLKEFRKEQEGLLQERIEEYMTQLDHLSMVEKVLEERGIDRQD